MFSNVPHLHQTNNAGISQGTKTTLAFMADVIKQDFG